ncbi:MAG: MFS transporter [Clostridiales bacterium]|jgi:Na+/melibiose symporter-like transporter|nr:MFS transporter [Clostridiales bacterium]
MNTGDTHAAVGDADKIPLKEKLLYGAADLFGGGHNTILSIILLYFFTDIIGIDPVLAGTVFLISKLWDAVIDPMLGSVSDNTRSKFGRRKPFILLGAVLIIPAYAFLFAPIQGFDSQTAKIVFAISAYLFYCTVASLSQVPFMSMSSDISSDFRERNSANLVKLVFDMISAGICFLIPTSLMDALQAGAITQTTFYLVIVFGFGTVFSIPLAAAAFKVKERTPIPEYKTKFDIKEWLSSFKIASYKYHIFMYITAFLCVDIVSALALYYVNDVLRGVMLAGKQIGSLYVIAPMMVLAALIIPVCYVIMQKKSKQFAYRVGLPLYAVGAVLLACYNTAWPSYLIPVFACIMGLGVGGAQMMPWLVFPDTVDVAELKLGYRPTGAFSGAMTFSRTLSTAIAIQLVGIGLKIAGYRQSTSGQDIVQPPSALLAVRIMLGASVVVLLLLAFLASMKYKVTDKKLERVRYFNEHSRQKTDDLLTEEEKEEKQKLLKELC